MKVILRKYTHTNTCVHETSQGYCGLPLVIFSMGWCFPLLYPQQEFLGKPLGFQPSLCSFNTMGPRQHNCCLLYPHTACGLCLRNQRRRHFLQSKPQLFAGTDFEGLVWSFWPYMAEPCFPCWNSKHLYNHMFNNYRQIYTLSKPASAYYIRVRVYKPLSSCAAAQSFSCFPECVCLIWLITASWFNLFQCPGRTDHKISYDTLLHNTLFKNKPSKQVIFFFYKTLNTNRTSRLYLVVQCMQVQVKYWSRASASQLILWRDIMRKHVAYLFLYLRACDFQ